MRLQILAVTLLVGFVVGRPQAPQGFAPPQFPQRPPLIPPGFNEHLPDEAKQKLIQLHFDKDLNFEQRRDKIEEVFDGLPKEVLAKLPLPPGLERLPQESKAKFKELHMNRDLNWRERHELVQKAIKELPEHEQRLVEPPRPPMLPPHMMGQGFHQGGPGQFGGPPPFPPHFAGPMGFPPHPPPGFELALAPTVYKQLMAVHSNPELSVADKKLQIDRIMANVPQEQLDKLPLPPGFDRLPAESLQRLRTLMHNFKLDWDERHQQVKEFIMQLPREERRLMRPPSPPGFEQLPEEIQDQIDAVFLDEKLTPPERHYKIHELIKKLPAEMRAKLPSPPPFMPPYMPQQQQGQGGQQEKDTNISDQQ